MSELSDIKAELLVLKAENAELRRERDFYFQQVTDNGERAHGSIDALNAENAKLRELVQYICDENYGDDWFMEEAAELGIEAHY